MNTVLTVKNAVDNAAILLPADGNKDILSRLRRFVAWLGSNDTPWYAPDLAAYRADLLATLAPASAAAHLATLRARYKTVLADNATRDQLFALAAQQANDPVTRKAFVDEVLTRLANAVNPLHSSVKTTTKQDRVAAEELRLTPLQATALMRKPGTDTLHGLRDTALIAFALATGLREAELAALTVADLRQLGSDGQTLGVYVREGKGAKSRLVPYGGNEQVLVIVDRWLAAAGITGGQVFRSFEHHSKTATDSITPRAIQDVLKAYPVMVNGKLQTVKPHDLRRTYAKLLYDGGMDIVAIQQNLGHSNLQTTLRYIGDTGLEKRKPRNVLSFDL